MPEDADRTSREARGAPPRRRFFERLLEVVAAGYFGVILYPLYRYLASGPKLVQSVEVTAVTVGTLKDMPPNTAKMFRFGGAPGVLIRAADGTLHAFNATCTHLNCTVQYRSDWEKIWCACHGSRFDTATGANESGPAPRPLLSWKVEVSEKGEIFVTRA